MTRLTVNTMDYNIQTTGSGTPLVLLHGFTGSITNWQHLIPKLAESHTVIAIDILGHGDTAKPQDSTLYTMAQIAVDVVGLIRALTVAPVTLLGYSMGGRLALYIAAHYPDIVRRLILESSSPGLADKAERDARRERDNTLADNIDQFGINWFVDYWESLPLWQSQGTLPQAKRDALRRQRLTNAPHGLANSLRGMGTGVQPSLWSKLRDVYQPTLLLTGEEDAKFVDINRRMQALMPSALLTVVPDAGHTTHLEQPEFFVRQVAAFARLLAERQR